MWDGKCHFAFLCFGCSFSPNKTCPCFAFVFGWVGYSTLLHDLKTSLGEIEWHNQNTWSESPFLAQSNPFGTLCIGEVRSCRRHFGWRTAIQMESSRTLVFRFQFEYCFNWISCTFDDSRYHVKKWKLMEKFMHVTILFGSCTAIQNASCQINCLDSQRFKCTVLFTSLLHGLLHFQFSQPTIPTTHREKSWNHFKRQRRTNLLDCLETRLILIAITRGQIKCLFFSAYWVSSHVIHVLYLENHLFCKFN